MSPPLLPATLLAFSTLTTIDWVVLGGYVVLIVASGIGFSRRKQKGTEDYFLAGRRMPVWAVAISIIATSLSAATFIGAPEQSFAGDLTYLSTNIGGLLAVVVVAVFFIPAFYKSGVVTIYELLERRFGPGAKFAASGAFMVGRVFASGARLFIGAIPMALILFGDSGQEPPEGQLVLGIVLLTVTGVLYTLAGGIASVIWTEVVQTAVLLAAVLAAVFVLLHKIPLSPGEIVSLLGSAGPDGTSKLKMLELGLDPSKPGLGFDPSRAYTLLTAIAGFSLIGLASYGTDHDLVQRMLTCKTALKGGQSVVSAILLSVPIVLLFLVIGLLLFIFYKRPDVMGAGAPGYSLDDSRKVFLTFILREMPRGLSGLMLAGLFSVGLSSLASALNAMAATFVRDFYRHMAKGRDEKHYLGVGRLAVAGWGVVLGGFACFCIVWQRSSNQRLIDFALGVMNFAYAGLLAVFLTAIFTKRGNTRSAIAALITGFCVVALLQPPVWKHWAAYVTWTAYTPFSTTERSLAEITLAFPWHLLIAASISMLVCVSGRRPRNDVDRG